MPDPLAQLSEPQKYQAGLGKFLERYLGGSGFVPKLALKMELQPYWREFLIEAWAEGSADKLLSFIKTDCVEEMYGGSAVPHVYLGLEQARVLKRALKKAPGRKDIAPIITMPTPLSQLVYEAAMTGESTVIPAPVIKQIVKASEEDKFNRASYRSIAMLLKDFADSEEPPPEQDEGEGEGEPPPPLLSLMAMAGASGWKPIASESSPEALPGASPEASPPTSLKDVMSKPGSSSLVMSKAEPGDLVFKPPIFYPETCFDDVAKKGVFDFDQAMKTVKLLEIEPDESVHLELTANTKLDQVAGSARSRIIVDRKGPFVKGPLAHRLIVGDTRIFGRVEKAEESPISVAFALDMSGSMSGSWQTVLRVMGSISHAIMRAGADSMAMGFCSSKAYCIFPIFKSLDDPFDPLRFSGYYPSEYENGNPDAIAVEWCRRQLLSGSSHRAAKSKFIIVFSDEEPAGPCPESVYTYSTIGHTGALNQAIYRCTLSGVKVISAHLPDHRLSTLKYHAKVEIQGVDTTLERLVTAMEDLLR